MPGDIPQLRVYVFSTGVSRAKFFITAQPEPLLERGLVYTRIVIAKAICVDECVNGRVERRNNYTLCI